MTFKRFGNAILDNLNAVAGTPAPAQIGWEGSPAAVAVAEPAGPKPKPLTPPVATAIQIEDDPNVFDFAEYKALVEELGVDDTAVRNHELRTFLAEQGIPVYDYRKVAEFMNAKVTAEAKAHNMEGYLTWLWKPISPKYPHDPRSGRAAVEAILDPGANSLPSGRMARSTPVYARPIPHAVLLTVKKIRDKFGDAVWFYATDYEVRNPDPFLMVTGPGLDFYVIERWDEPGFRS